MVVVVGGLFCLYGNVVSVLQGGVSLDKYCLL